MASSGHRLIQRFSQNSLTNSPGKCNTTLTLTHGMENKNAASGEQSSVNINDNVTKCNFVPQVSSTTI